jgi:hypothetical protein
MAKAYKNAIYNTIGCYYRANLSPAAFDKPMNYDCDFGVCLAATEEGC